MISWVDHVRNEEVLQSQGEEYPAYSKRVEDEQDGSYLV
jgi:hypothetical protein